MKASSYSLFRRTQRVAMERLRDRFAAATAANRFSFRETSELPARFSRWFARSSMGFLKLFLWDEK